MKDIDMLFSLPLTRRSRKHDQLHDRRLCSHLWSDAAVFDQFVGTPTKFAKRSGSISRDPRGSRMSLAIDPQLPEIGQTIKTTCGTEEEVHVKYAPRAARGELVVLLHPRLPAGVYPGSSKFLVHDLVTQARIFRFPKSRYPSREEGNSRLWS